MGQVSLHDYCDEASSLIQSGEFDRAIHITRHILGHYPRHVESYRLLGQALLEAGLYQEASRQFRRVLSADPEDVTARVGLARVHEAADDLDKALWHMWRAFDLSAGNLDLRRQLRRLIEARHGDREDTLQITRAALGRIYARGGLHTKAIQELEAVLTQEPTRLDVQIALAENLWRTGRRLEATEVCYYILKKRPNALKANLIVGAMWLDSPQPDKAQSYLTLAQALDPENVVAQSLLGDKSSLTPVTIKIERLSQDELERTLLRPAPTGPVEDMPLHPRLEPAVDWMSELHEEEATLMSDEKQEGEEFELPDWLQGVGDDLLEENVEAADTRPSGPSSESADDETPEWLRNLVARTAEQPASEEPGTPDDIPSTEPGEVPDWLQELRPEIPEEASADASTPDWLTDIAAGESIDETELEAAPDTTEPASIPADSSTAQPDWLSETEEPEPQLEAPEADSESVAGADEGRALWEQILAEEGVDLASAEEERPAGAEGMPAEEWLRSTLDQAATPTGAVTKHPKDEVPEPSILEPMSDIVEDSDVPDWLREIAVGEPASPELAAAPEPASPESEADEAGLPDWLRQVTDGETVRAEEGEIPPVPPAPAEIPEGLAEVDKPITELEPSEAGPEEAETTGLPDWLREAQEQESEAEILPDSLVEPEEEVPVAEAEVDEAGLPDWLREPIAESAELPETEGEQAAEAPDWLKALEFEEVPLGEPGSSEPIELETGEMPEWLTEVMAEEGPLTEELVEPETAVSVEAEMREEHVPDWLRDIRGEDEAEAPAEPALEVVEMETPQPPEGEAGPELPDWLRRLREGIPEETPPAPAEYPEGEPEIAAAEAPPEAAAYPPTVPEEVEEIPPVEVPPEPEAVQPEAAGPEWLGELVRDEERLEEIEAIEEEIASAEPTPPVEYVEIEEAEVPSAAPPEPEPVAAPAPPTPAPITTRYLEPLRAEDLPEDPAARLAMARATLNAGDWAEALLIYQSLVNSSELLDDVIGDLESGVSRHPDAEGFQLLGDACMKDGRLQDALQAYRTALASL